MQCGFNEEEREVKCHGKGMLTGGAGVMTDCPNGWGCLGYSIQVPFNFIPFHS